MSRIRVASAILCCVLLFAASPAWSQQSSNTEPHEPYQDDEFPQWLRDLRRAEIVLIGSFPITMLVTTLIYDAFRSIRDTITSVPITERSEFGSYSDTERPWLIVSGVSLSSIITIIDAIIEQRKRARALDAPS